MITLTVFPSQGLAVPLAKEGDAYFIVFEKMKLPPNAEAIIEECGGRVVHKYPNIGVLTALPMSSPSAFEEMLAQRDDVSRFGHDYVAEVPKAIIQTMVAEDAVLESGPVPVDPYYWYYQWHLWHTIEASPWGAWEISTGDPDIKVAILDTGIDYLHPDLAPNYDFVLSRSFVDWDFDGIPDEPPMDENGHGSHCAGIVAAAINNDLTTAKCVGIGPDLTLVNLKVMGAGGSGYFAWDFDAIYYAVENGIDVVSMSFGAYVPMFDQGGSALMAALQRLFNYANRNGIVCIASAGNSYMDMDGLYSWRHLPSQCANVISVIATNIYNDLSFDPGVWGTNYGSCLFGMSAPGGDAAVEGRPDWYWTLPPGVWNPVYGYVFSTYAMTASGYMYAWMGGTSMAVPHVAGVAGLILSVNPRLRPSQVKHYLFQGATDIGDPGYDQFFNFGLLNAYNSLEAMN